MAMNPLPILALGAAALILGGNKKKSSSGPSSGTSGGGTGGGGTGGGGTSGGGTGGGGTSGGGTRGGGTSGGGTGGGGTSGGGSPSGADRVGSEDVIVTDSGCNDVLHVSQKFYRIQRDKVIRYAMDEMFQREHARNITDEMFEEYLPWCTILGPDGFGPGLKNFYDRNIDTVYADLSAYKNFPDRISKDAAERGIG